MSCYTRLLQAARGRPDSPSGCLLPGLLLAELARIDRYPAQGAAAADVASARLANVGTSTPFERCSTLYECLRAMSPPRP